MCTNLLTFGIAVNFFNHYVESYVSKNKDSALLHRSLSIFPILKTCESSNNDIWTENKFFNLRLRVLITTLQRHQDPELENWAVGKINVSAELQRNPAFTVGLIAKQHSGYAFLLYRSFRKTFELSAKH